MTGNADREEGDDKGEKRRCLFWDLPRENIEDICEILKANNRKKESGNLERREQIAPWTPRTWKADVYCRGKLPEVFSHVKHIMLVSPTESNSGEDNGWNFADLMFWEPLLRQHRTPLRKKSLGQLIHHFSPNLKYAAVIAAPARQVTSPTASVYVSDRDLIERRDTAAFRKIIFDTIWEIRHGRNAGDFTDVKEPPEFRADRLNVPEFRDLLQITKDNNYLSTIAPERAVAENFAAFRDTVMYFVDGVTFLLHLTTETAPNAMTKAINSKVINLFSIAKRLLTEDKVAYKKPKFFLAMDVDFQFNNIPQGEDFFMRLAFWMVELSRHKSLLLVGNPLNGPYDLFARPTRCAHKLESTSLHSDVSIPRSPPTTSPAPPCEGFSALQQRTTGDDTHGQGLSG